MISPELEWDDHHLFLFWEHYNIKKAKTQERCGITCWKAHPS